MLLAGIHAQFLPCTFFFLRTRNLTWVFTKECGAKLQVREPEKGYGRSEAWIPPSVLLAGIKARWDDRLTCVDTYVKACGDDSLKLRPLRE